MSSWQTLDNHEHSKAVVGLNKIRANFEATSARNGISWRVSGPRRVRRLVFKSYKDADCGGEVPAALVYETESRPSAAIQTLACNKRLFEGYPRLV